MKERYRMLAARRCAINLRGAVADSPKSYAADFKGTTALGLMATYDFRDSRLAGPRRTLVRVPDVHPTAWIFPLKAMRTTSSVSRSVKLTQHFVAILPMSVPTHGEHEGERGRVKWRRKSVTHRLNVHAQLPGNVLACAKLSVCLEKHGCTRGPRLIEGRLIEGVFSGKKQARKRMAGRRWW